MPGQIDYNQHETNHPTTKVLIPVPVLVPFNPKATERYIKVQNLILFPFSFNTVEFLADVLSWNSLALSQRKYT